MYPETRFFTIVEGLYYAIIDEMDRMRSKEGTRSRKFVGEKESNLHYSHS